MDLVNELQISAEQDDVLTVLRKVRRLASKLQLKEPGDWLCFEQNGYKDASKVPSYRQISATFCLYAPIPVQINFHQEVQGTLPIAGFPTVEVPYTKPITRVLADIESLNKSEGKILAEECSADIKQLISEYMQDPIPPGFTIYTVYDKSGIRAIPEALKDFVLDWALALEQSGVRGEEMSFTSLEIEVAKTVNFYIRDSHIEQLTDSGKNERLGS